MKNNIDKNNVRILANNCCISNDTFKTGLNNNDLIIGPSGAGKTRNYVKPNIMQCNESIIVADTKGSLYYETKDVLMKNGYRVMLIDFNHLPASTCGYNPLDYIRINKNTGKYVEQDIITIANALVTDISQKEPYWDNSAIQYLVCLIAFVMEALPKEEHTLEYVLKVFHEMRMPHFDELMYQLEDENPDSIAVRKYRTIQQNKSADKTHSSIMTVLSTHLERLSFNEIFDIFKMKNRVDIKSLGLKKTALFVSVSDTDSSMNTLVNLFYTQVLQKLCDYADNSCENYRLPAPVRIILDDFAANVFIPDFDKIISIIRSRNIAVSVILQSISQLEGLYGHSKAMTIINNCDNCLYLGGQDVDTARYIGTKINLTPTSVLNLPLDKAYLFTRGSKPKAVEKYDIKNHNMYRQLNGEFELTKTEINLADASL